MRLFDRATQGQILLHLFYTLKGYMAALSRGHASGAYACEWTSTPVSMRVYEGSTVLHVRRLCSSDGFCTLAFYAEVSSLSDMLYIPSRCLSQEPATKSSSFSTSSSSIRSSFCSGDFRPVLACNATTTTDNATALRNRALNASSYAPTATVFSLPQQSPY
jgi:hypothetical protein